jgi:microcystin-dependent protein
MSDQFVAEIRIVPFNFPPTGWTFCDGQLMPISQNTALFSLLGTVYGGDGKSTFALPDMQGNCGVGSGLGSGLSEKFLGEMAGSSSVTLLTSEIPFHTHAMQAAADDPAESNDPTNFALARSKNGFAYTPTLAPIVQMAVEELPPAGGSLPHNNMMPYLTLNYIIALQGIFPQRP